MQVKKQQLELDMEQQTGSKLGKEYVKAVYCHPAYLTSMLSASATAKSLQSCLTLCDPMDGSPPGSSGPWTFPGKNTGVGAHAFLQGIFLTHGSNPCLLCLLQWHSSTLMPPGKPQDVLLIEVQ